MVDYPADGESRNDKRITALGLDFKVLNAGSEGALIAELKAAALPKQPYVMMFWRPHWIHSAYPGGWGELPKHATVPMALNGEATLMKSMTVVLQTHGSTSSPGLEQKTNGLAYTRS
jgi:ABC-type proline/glycine betaine transport system substrate-binding protein